MSTITLLHTVCTLDNQRLLPAGSSLSEETIGALVSASGHSVPQAHSLLQHGSVKEDLLHLLNQPPYQVIFAGPTRVSNMLNVTAQAQLIGPVLQSLDYFRHHDFHTYRHVLLVSALSTLLAADLVSDFQDLMREAGTAPCHDFGKICVPLHILRKVDPLTRTERAAIEHHTVAGYVLLGYYMRDSKNFAAKVARDHHERNDGSGYPRGIHLRDPVVEIVAASDVYDALISPRPYRPVPYDNRTALEEITAMAERNALGWDVVKALVALNRKSKPHYSECVVSAERRGTPPPGNSYGITIDEETNPSNTNDS